MIAQAGNLPSWREEALEVETSMIGKGVWGDDWHFAAEGGAPQRDACPAV